MAIQTLHGFPQFSAFVFRMELNGIRLQFRMTFRERTKSWYLDMFESNGDPLMLGKRLSPFWSPTFGAARISGLIEGSIFVRGNEGYKQEDLSRELDVWYIPKADLAFFQPTTLDPLAPTIVLGP